MKQHKKIKPKISDLWKHINQQNISHDNIKNLKNFKSSKVNFKIALWDPKTNGLRYMKTLLYNTAIGLSKNTFKKLKKIKNRNLGHPFTISYNNERICMDYLQAVLELEFIEKYVEIDNCSILEIGAGYGRTCHAIFANNKINNYSIIDLPNCLKLARNYLHEVLDEKDFSKIRFIDIRNIDSLTNSSFDLAINIDSFSEMDSQTVHYYLEFIKKYCHHFYVKNPVGKYLDKSLDSHSQGRRVVGLALKTGLLLDIVDIFDNQAIKKQAKIFNKIYRPGKSWQCLGSSWAKPWSYYWQAFYKKNDS